MTVYEIPKELAPVFAEFVPKYILGKTGMPGYHTLGEVVMAAGEYYTAGFIQVYDGTLRKSHEAAIIYLYVPEDEREQNNAWSLLMETERRLRMLGVKKLTVNMNDVFKESLAPYFTKMGFSERTNMPKLVTAPFGELAKDKLLSMPDSSKVRSFSEVTKSELTRVMHLLSGSTLSDTGIDPDINADDYSMKISQVYHNDDQDGILLAKKRPEGGLVLKLCRCTGKDVQKGMALLLSAASKAAKQIYTDETPIIILCYNDNTMSVIRAINPDVEIKSIWQGEKSYE
ncbi:MAG: hypothetical protein K6B14_04550 [Lachnospiraceae bacterium]|nr:hypothetical protein [Lachnospiraceae bacterium]